MPFEKIHATHRIAIFPSPMEADLAVLPAFIHGRPSYPNEYVQSLYGYTQNVSPEEDLLKDGFVLIKRDKNPPILYIVTEDGKKSTRGLIEDNFLKALLKCESFIQGQKVWLPILGPETGTIGLEESYELTAKALNQFIQRAPRNVQFIISIPDTREGRSLFQKIGKEQDMINLLNLLNAQVFLGGSNWEGDEQNERFYQDSIWEKGHNNDTYSDIIFTIQTGDILINKSAFPKRTGENILRLKAIGIVTTPSSDGASVGVDWKMIGLKVDIPEYGAYNRTIAGISQDDAAYILSFLAPLDQDRFIDNFHPARNGTGTALKGPTNTLKIAGLINDSDRGSDYLDISRDVAAFSRVIAAKTFEPPLAIALFGKWGSGKSFFMRTLKESILYLAANNIYNTYCEGVAHIHFNAWSYMDANLWASFVSRIFEGLNEYISQNTESEKFKKQIEKELGSALQMTKEEIQILENKKQTVQHQIDALQKERKIAKDKLNENLNALKSQTLTTTLNAIDKQFQASEKILAACKENQSFITTEKDLKAIVPGEYLQNPSEAYRRITSTLNFLKECCRWRSIWGNMIFLLFFLILFLFIPIGLQVLTDKIGYFNFLILQPMLTALIPLSVLLSQTLRTYNRMKPVIAAFWKIKQEYEQKRLLATEQFEQREKALTLQIEKDSNLLVSLTAEVQKAQSLKNDLEFKIENILATEALYSFIEKRSSSEDYKKHLGIISIIRRDLETLNSLFTDHHEETSRIKVDRFRQKFRKPLERIVLYVDDLDRCSEDTVVQVLEAVNLLMAFPLFIVIVGVDPRWVNNALLKRHSLQFTGYPTGGSEQMKEIKMIDTSSYLEKIFQIPFHLKEAPPVTIRSMIRNVALSAQSRERVAATKTGANVNTYDQQTPPTNNDSPELALRDEASTIHAPIPITEIIEHLFLSEQEIEMLEDLGEIVGPNPRALKRFINIFRIVKVHEDFLRNSDSPEGDMLATLLLLSLSIGIYKNLVPAFEKFILELNNSEKTLRSFFKGPDLNSEEESLAHQLNVALSNNKNYYMLQETKTSVFAKHNTFIRRFTFNQ